MFALPPPPQMTLRVSLSSCLGEERYIFSGGFIPPIGAKVDLPNIPVFTVEAVSITLSPEEEGGMLWINILGEKHEVVFSPNSHYI